MSPRSMPMACLALKPYRLRLALESKEYILDYIVNAIPSI